MNKNIEYYLSLQSPWTYLGHERFTAIARKHNATIAIKPISAAIVFPATGGLPVGKRAPARQAYRLMEIRRWRKFLDLPMNLEPAHFPADEALAMRLVVALRKQNQEQAVRLAGLILRAVWAENKDIGDPKVLMTLCSQLAIDGKPLMTSEAEHTATIARESNQAISAGVFGMPSYVYQREVYWGQDRLDFLDRALALAV